MPRLLGVEIPADKRIEASLTYIYGVGPSTAKRVLEQTNIDPNLRAKDPRRSRSTKSSRRSRTASCRSKAISAASLQANLKRLQAINCYRGIRYRWDCLFADQRTSTNARTRKGPRKTVGVIRNKDAKAGKV
jgi:small subunit ribosomal protein S13